MDLTCKNCGNVFGDHLTVCPSCGAPVEPVSEETKVADVEPQVLPEAQQPEVQQPEAQAYQQQAYQQPYQQQPYQQQPYQQQPYQQQAYQQQPYQQQPYQQQTYQQPYQQPVQNTAYNPNAAYQAGAPVYNPNMMGQRKSKLVAGLLGIFIGGFGVHNFYLGYTSKAVIQIVVSLLTCGIGSLWGFIEGIMILAGSINTDANGVPLGE